MASSLYERFGGVYSIAAVVDDFIDRIMDNPPVDVNSKVNEAHHRVSRAGFKYLVTEMVCWAAGGPQQYSGRSMLDSDAHLGITEDEWQVFRADVRACLDKFASPRRSKTTSSRSSKARSRSVRRRVASDRPPECWNRAMLRARETGDDAAIP